LSGYSHTPRTYNRHFHRLAVRWSQEPSPHRCSGDRCKDGPSQGIGCRRLKAPPSLHSIPWQDSVTTRNTVRNGTQAYFLMTGAGTFSVIYLWFYSKWINFKVGTVCPDCTAIKNVCKVFSSSHILRCSTCSITVQSWLISPLWAPLSLRSHALPERYVPVYPSPPSLRDVSR